MIMVWPSIVVTAVIAILMTVIFFTVKANIRLQKDVDKVTCDNFRLQRETYDNLREIKYLEKQLSYQDGMRVARKTDTLYTQILKRCADNNERFSVMMNGMKDGDSK